MKSGVSWLLLSAATVILGISVANWYPTHKSYKAAQAAVELAAHCDQLNELNQAYKACANLDKCLFSVDDILRYSSAREDAQTNCPALISHAPPHSVDDPDDEHPQKL